MVSIFKCKKCGIEKELEKDFPVKKTNKLGYRSSCTDCENIRKQEWAKKNPDKAKKSRKRYYEKNKERILEKNRLWYAENSERVAYLHKVWNEKNKDVVKERTKTWAQNNPDKILAGVHKRRALKMGRGHVPYTRAEIFERDGWICGICSNDVDSSLKWPHPKSPTIDHILPLSMGGPDCPENVQLAHAKCNITKGHVKFSKVKATS